MVDEALIHILVVEDEPFQRLAMIDILSLLDYEVETAEDGHMAWELLKQKGSTYDLVLLDLELPGMDGLELLGKLKETPDLKDIPVVMLSAHSEMDKVYASLDLGALDYLIKPIRPGAVKTVVNQLKIRPKNSPTVETGLKAYERIRTLGRGAFASVDLVRKKSTGELLALKKIDMQFLSNERDRRNAENEATLMRVLVGPTIIQFHEQIVEEQTLYICMEFASGGCLSEKLQELRNRGERLSDEQIIMWFAQIIIALMIMHSKHVLHRDLKTENLFLQGNIIKVGDLGIAKSLSNSYEMAQSVAGTPYSMAPEILRQEKYGQKTDIWSLGCVLYEMATFKRPFEGKDVQSLIDVVLNKEYQPLPDYVDTNIKLLVSQMLNKDPNRRPTVWDLANMPIVKEHITKFVEETTCADTIMPLFDHDPRNRKKAGNAPKPNIIQVSDIASFARSEMSLQDKKIGWFGKTYQRVLTGNELLEYLQSKYKYTLDQSRNAGQEMLEQGLIHNIDGQSLFSQTLFYQFREDRTDVARNMIYLWSKDVRVPHVVVRDLVQIANQIITTYKDDIETIRNSNEYRELIRAVGELQRVETRNLTRNEKVEFFLAVYQIMALHQMIELGETKAGWFKDPADNFYYCINFLNYTLKELKHGVLRGNKKSPGSYTRVFYNSDPRNMLPNHQDPRVLIVCQDPPYPIQPIIDFHEGVDDILEKKTEEYCNREVCLNLSVEELILPKLFQTYQADFGGTEEAAIRWLWKFFTACKISDDNVISMINRQKLYVQYRE